MEALEENFPRRRSCLPSWKCEDRQAAITTISFVL